jgi:hypothetical protein
LSLFCSILSNVDWSEELLLTAEALGALSVAEGGTLNPLWDAIASARITSKPGASRGYLVEAAYCRKYGLGPGLVR